VGLLDLPFFICGLFKGMNLLKFLLLLLLFLPASALAINNKALIYAGQGVCPEDCAETFIQIAQSSNLIPVLVYDTPEVANLLLPQLPNDKSFLISDGSNLTDLLADAAVWIMPGGHSVQEVSNMPPDMYQQVIAYVNGGGGYLGFCAGAFSATSLIGTTSVNGFGIFPGNTQLYTNHSGLDPDILKITWSGNLRYIYWEGGPFLYNLPDSVEKIAYYPDGSIAAARTTYGLGKVFLSGVHPEAPQWWRNGLVNGDPDGLDFDLVTQMITWASKP
jgi:Biotin-protein ligase, N terminal